MNQIGRRYKQWARSNMVFPDVILNVSTTKKEMENELKENQREKFLPSLLPLII